jgi:hypothetical protein
MSPNRIHTAVLRLDGGQVLPISERLALGRRPEDHAVVARIGREEIDLGVRDATISRQHAALFWKDEALWVQDLGSTWGTWIDDQRLSSNGLRCAGTPLTVPERATLRLGSRLTFAVERMSHREIAPEVSTGQFAAMTAHIPPADLARWHALSNWAHEIADVLAHSVTLGEVENRCGKALGHLRPDEAPYRALADNLARLDAQLRLDEQLDQDQIQALLELCTSVPTLLVEEWL